MKFFLSNNYWNEKDCIVSFMLYMIFNFNLSYVFSESEKLW